MTRTKPAEQRRADLLAAGEELFVAKGVAATSLDDITSRAGVSKGLFYLYFRSKDELLAAMQDQFSVRLADRIRAATDLTGDWPGKLDACVQVIFDSYQESHDLHEVLFQHAGHVSASHRSTHGLVLGVISDLLAGGKAAGVFDVEDPEATAMLCWASTHGFDPGFSGEPEGAPPDDRRGAGGPGREEEEIIATSEEGGGERDQQREPAPADRRLIRAARQLFRRAAGLADGPQGASDCGADSVRPG